MNDRNSLVIVFAAFTILPSGVTANEFSVTPLTADEQSMLAAIEEKSVLATVSFLASDEMNGRDTPSTELNIAARYVADRFLKAGLAGLGPDGSFFQTTELFQTSGPATKAILSTNSPKNIPLPVFTGINDALKIHGVVTVDAADKPERQTNQKSEIFVMDELKLPPQAADSPLAALVTYVRHTAALVRKGAKVVLVRVSDDSILYDAAAAFQMHQISIPAQFEPQCAIVLVSKTLDLNGEVSLEIPANVRKGSSVYNVIGVLRGSDPDSASKAVMISAHLDHIGLAQRGEDKINNGADDNASGVTGVLTLADAFGKLKDRPRRSMIFMTFWGEEKGLLGSKHFAAEPLWKLEDIVCNVNLEMIGRPEENAEGKAWGTGWPHSSLGPQMAAGANRVGVTIFNHEQFGEMLYTRSDNASFVAKGVIAHSFSAGSLHSDYHQPTDEVAKLNIPHMTRVIQGMAAGILPIARGELTPTKTR